MRKRYFAERKHGSLYYLFFATVLTIRNRNLYSLRCWKSVPVRADICQWRCERVWIREMKKKIWPMREWEGSTPGVDRCSCSNRPACGH